MAPQGASGLVCEREISTWIPATRAMRGRDGGFDAMRVAGRRASVDAAAARFVDALPRASLGIDSAPQSTAPPTGPGEVDDDVFPIRERIRLRDNFGLALLELRARNEEFQRLGKGPWALFIGIAVHWQGNA
jgi:hypothetical protein